MLIRAAVGRCLSAVLHPKRTLQELGYLSSEEEDEDEEQREESSGIRSDQDMDSRSSDLDTENTSGLLERELTEGGRASVKKTSGLTTSTVPAVSETEKLLLDTLAAFYEKPGDKANGSAALSGKTGGMNAKLIPHLQSYLPDYAFPLLFDSKEAKIGRGDESPADKVYTIKPPDSSHPPLIQILGHSLSVIQHGEQVWTVMFSTPDQTSGTGGVVADRKGGDSSVRETAAFLSSHAAEKLLPAEVTDNPVAKPLVARWVGKGWGFVATGAGKAIEYVKQKKQSMGGYAKQAKHLPQAIRILKSTVPAHLNEVKRLMQEHGPVGVAEMQTLWKETEKSLNESSGSDVILKFIIDNLGSSASQLRHFVTSWTGLHRPASPPSSLTRSAEVVDPVDHQSSHEWLPLVEWAKGATISAKMISALLCESAQKIKLNGGQLNEDQIALITKTKQALETSQFDALGYYQYLPEGQETHLSQGIKALTNVIWAVNELCRGYWEHPQTTPGRMAAHWQMLTHGMQAFNHYWRISWPGMVSEGGAFVSQIMDTFLVVGRDLAFPPLRLLAKHLHRMELGSHLAFGSLSQSFRPYFDFMEDLFHKHNLGPGENPFGYNEEQVNIVRRRLTTANKEQAEKKSDLVSFNVWIGGLQEVQKNKKFDNFPTLLLQLTGLYEKISSIYPVAASTASADLCETALSTVTEAEDKADGENPVVAIRGLIERTITLIPAKDREVVATQIRSLKDSSEQREVLEKLSRTTLSDKPEKELTEEDKRHLMRVLQAAEKAKFTFSLAVEFDIQKYEEALRRLQAMRTEFDLRQLKQHGLIGYFEAVKSKKGTPQERQLAVLLADMGAINAEAEEQERKSATPQVTEESKHTIHAARVAYLQDAYQKTKSFMGDQEAIKKFIVSVAKIDPSTGSLLAIEVWMAGYADDLSLGSQSGTDSRFRHQALCNLLERLTLDQFLKLVQDEDKKRLTYLAMLLLESSQFPDISGDSQDVATRRKYLITVLFNGFENRLTSAGTDSAESPESTESMRQRAEIRQKIVLCLGRLAHADSEIAKLVFADEDKRKVLEQECLGKDARGSASWKRALYYESLVHTFKFDYEMNDHAKERRNYAEFIGANSNIVVEIYKASEKESQWQRGVERKENSEEIIRKCKENPVEFFSKVEKFILTCLSPGSPAERQMREFFSAMLLCQGVEKVHESMLEWFEGSGGAKSTRYIEFITPNASARFWQKAKDILVSSPYKTRYFRKYDAAARAMSDFIRGKEFIAESTPNEAVNSFEESLRQFVGGEKEAISSALYSFSREADNTARRCVTFQQLFTASLLKIDNRCAMLKAKLESRKKNEAEILKLHKKLEAIIRILENYISQRERWFNALGYLCGKSLRHEKVMLAYKYLREFKSFKSRLESLEFDGLESLKGEIVKAGDCLKESHRLLVLADSEATGNFAERIQKINSISKPENHELAVNLEDFVIPVSQISELINQIRNGCNYLYNSLCSLFGSTARGSAATTTSPISQVEQLSPGRADTSITALTPTSASAQ